MRSPGQPDHPKQTSTPGPGVESLFPPRGRHTYLVTVEDRIIVEARAVQQGELSGSRAEAASPFIDRYEVAQMLGLSPCTVSRRRKKLEAEGLIGRRLGGRKYMWRLEAVIEYGEKKGLTGRRRPGRPRRYT